MITVTIGFLSQLEIGQHIISVDYDASIDGVVDIDSIFFITPERKLDAEDWRMLAEAIRKKEYQRDWADTICLTLYFKDKQVYPGITQDK